MVNVHDHAGLHALVRDLLGEDALIRTCRVDTVSWAIGGQDWAVVLVDDAWVKAAHGFETNFLKWAGDGWKDCEPTEHQRKIYAWMITLA